MKIFFNKDRYRIFKANYDYYNIHYENSDELSNQLLKVNFKNINTDKDKKIVKSFGIFPYLSKALLFHNNDEMYVTITFNISNNQNQKIKFYNGREYTLLDNNYYEGLISNYNKLRISVEKINNELIINFNSIEISFYDSANNILTEYNTTTNIYDSYLKEIDYTKCFHKLDNINKINETANNSICNINKYCYVLNIHNAVIPNNTNLSLLFQSKNSFHLIKTFFDSKTDIDTDNYALNNNLYYYPNIIDTPVYFLSVCLNYLHFVRDSLPYLFHFIELKKIIPNIKLILLPVQKHPPFVYDFLHSLNISETDIYHLVDYLKEKTFFKQVYTGLFWDNFDRDKFYIDSIREEIFNKIYYKNCLKNITNKKRRLYISRRIRNDMGNNVGQNRYADRYLHNELELSNLFKQYDFEEIWSEDFTLQQKIQLFQECEYIFFQHSGFTINIDFIKNTNIYILNCGYSTSMDDPTIKHSIKYNKNNIHIINNIYTLLNKTDIHVYNGLIDLKYIKQILEEL